MRLAEPFNSNLILPIMPAHRGTHRSENLRLRFLERTTPKGRSFLAVSSMSDRNRGHGSIKIHGIPKRVYFRLAERPDGQFDFTIADDKGFSLAVEMKVLPSMEAVVQEIGNIGK